MNKRMLQMAFGMGLCGALATLAASGGEAPAPTPADVKAVMAKVADWQMANPSKHHPAGWHHGAYYAGLMAWAQMADADTYHQELLKIAEQLKWQPHSRVYHADDHCVGQMYIDLYRLHGEPRMIQGIRDRFDFILANPSNVTLEFGKQHNKDRWWWCDALFMAPPALARLTRVTGNAAYLDFMNREWWATTDYLYDTEEHLYLRDDRFFTRRENNGRKIFWSRGNGWVFAGLARVLDELSADAPDRARYEQLFREMAEKLVAVQPADGLWRASLLDPERYTTGEASGTGFIAYGLAWGVNRGHLDEADYRPAILKAWNALVGCVQPNGMLGHVQPVGDSPVANFGPEVTEVYGVGAFLLAGSEVCAMLTRAGAPVRIVTLENPIPAFRPSATQSVAWAEVAALPGVTPETAGVFDLRHMRFLATQGVDRDGDGTPDELLFQLNLAPGDLRRVWLMKRPEGVAAPAVPDGAFGRFVPERKDDYAWENDRIAFRMYGRALEDELVSTGVDVWGKRVPHPVINAWYKKDDYHTDHGEGLDFYSVGKTLGCGGVTLIQDGTWHPSRNFRSARTLAAGPIRVIFELTYDAWEAAGVKVSHVLRGSLDRGSNLTRYESRFQVEGGPPEGLRPAAGIAAGEKDRRVLNADAGWIAYEGAEDAANGRMRCGLVFERPGDARLLAHKGHLLGVGQRPLAEPFVFYGGAGWSRVPAFERFEPWTAYLDAFANELRNPVLLKVK
jgi:unsaturated rhamnogalacturonyl hydrolase